MKKKLLCLTIALSLLVGSTMSVSAAQVQTDGETADIQLTYDQASTFCVNIPESISLNSADGYTFTADYINITDNQQVCVLAPMGEISLTNEHGKRGTVYLSADKDNMGNCVALFERDETTSSIAMRGQFDGTAAGHYSGTVTFTIQLRNKDS